MKRTGISVVAVFAASADPEPPIAAIGDTRPASQIGRQLWQPNRIDHPPSGTRSQRPGAQHTRRRSGPLTHTQRNAKNTVIYQIVIVHYI
jgi:hypothetical protein